MDLNDWFTDNQKETAFVYIQIKDAPDFIHSLVKPECEKNGYTLLDMSEHGRQHKPNTMMYLYLKKVKTKIYYKLEHVNFVCFYFKGKIDKNYPKKYAFFIASEHLKPVTHKVYFKRGGGRREIR